MNNKHIVDEKNVFCTSVHVINQFNCFLHLITKPRTYTYIAQYSSKVGGTNPKCCAIWFGYKQLWRFVRAVHAKNCFATGVLNIACAGMNFRCAHRVVMILYPCSTDMRTVLIFLFQARICTGLFGPL